MTKASKKRYSAALKAKPAARGALAAPADLEELQTSPRTFGVHLNYREVEVLDPQRLAAAFAAADTGFITDQARLYELIEQQDVHVFGEMGKRRRAVTGLGMALEAPDDATESELGRMKELQGILDAIEDFEQAKYDATDAIGKGLSALEIEWTLGDVWAPRRLRFEPLRHFRTDRDTSELLYMNMGVPEPLRPHRWAVFSHRSLSGYIESAALFRVLAWAYAYKSYNQADMDRFLRKYGMPTVLGKYPSGIAADLRNKLKTAVRNIGHDGAGIVPNTMTIDFLTAVKSGNGIQDFLGGIEYWEKKQSMAILGGTLTSQADGKTSTHALGKIHNEVRREIVLDDVRQLEPDWDRQLIRPICLFNGLFPDNRRPKLRYLTQESVDQEKLIKVLGDGAAMGMRIDLDWAHKALQIPRASEGATLLVAPAAGKVQPAPTDFAPTADLRRLLSLAALARGGKDPGVTGQDLTADFAARLAALCAPIERARIDQVAALVAQAGDFDGAIEALEALAISPDFRNTANWAEQLAQGMAAANLGGRVEIGSGE